MKTFAQKIQEAAQKAIRMKQAVEGAPLKVAEFRQALQQTTHELQSIGHDVQATISGLKLADPNSMPDAIHQISVAAPVLLEAGYVVSGFEMELGPIHRLVLALTRAEKVPLPMLSSLVQRHATEGILHGLLEAVLEAESVVSGLELPDLTYHHLRIHLGAIPTIRLIWESKGHANAQLMSHHSAPVLPHSMTGSHQVPTPAIPAYGQSSFFERRSAAVSGTPQPPRTAQLEPAAAVATPAHTAPSSPTTQHSYSKDWGRGALDRFKKMPNLGASEH